MDREFAFELGLQSREVVVALADKERSDVPTRRGAGRADARRVSVAATREGGRAIGRHTALTTHAPFAHANCDAARGHSLCWVLGVEESREVV